MKLELKNFRGIKEGFIELKNLNILIGSNNSGKTTVLESLFLVPNPLRYVPYGVNETAIGVLSSLHSTLGSEAFIFLLHYYSCEPASISCIDHPFETKVMFQKAGGWIEVYLEENLETFCLGKLDGSSKMYDVPSAILKAEKDKTSEKLLRTTVQTMNMSPRNYISKNLGEALYFHSSLMKSMWEYLRYHWVELRNIGLTSKVAKKISEGVSDEYDDLLLEPFIGNQQTIYVRTKDGRGIRLGDLGDGVQVLVTLMLLYEFIKPKILLIDDIESHMNPSLLVHTTLWFEDILKNNTRLVVSTHSLEAAKFIADVLEEHEPQITLLALRNGILSSKNLSLEEVENLEKEGIDIRTSKGILI